MNELFLKIINMSISASWLVLAVLILRLVLKKAPKWVNVLLWGSYIVWNTHLKAGMEANRFGIHKNSPHSNNASLRKRS